MEALIWKEEIAELRETYGNENVSVTLCHPSASSSNSASNTQGVLDRSDLECCPADDDDDSDETAHEGFVLVQTVQVTLQDVCSADVILPCVDNISIEAGDFLPEADGEEDSNGNSRAEAPIVNREECVEIKKTFTTVFRFFFYLPTAGSTADGGSSGVCFPSEAELFAEDTSELYVVIEMRDECFPGVVFSPGRHRGQVLGEAEMEGMAREVAEELEAAAAPFMQPPDDSADCVGSSSSSFFFDSSSSGKPLAAVACVSPPPVLLSYIITSVCDAQSAALVGRAHPLALRTQAVAREAERRARRVRDNTRRYLQRRQRHADREAALLAYLCPDSGGGNNINNNDGTDGKGAGTPRQPRCELGRRCIYFHHIYCPVKRACIREWAEALGLAALVKLGLPGFIVCEGAEAATAEYVRRLQSLRWKYMAVRGEEVLPLPAASVAALLFPSAAAAPATGASTTMRGGGGGGSSANAQGSSGTAVGGQHPPGKKQQQRPPPAVSSVEEAVLLLGAIRPYQLGLASSSSSKSTSNGNNNSSGKGGSGGGGGGRSDQAVWETSESGVFAAWCKECGLEELFKTGLRIYA